MLLCAKSATATALSNIQSVWLKPKNKGSLFTNMIYRWYYFTVLPHSNDPQFSLCFTSFRRHLTYKGFNKEALTYTCQSSDLAVM